MCALVKPLQARIPHACTVKLSTEQIQVVSFTLVSSNAWRIVKLERVLLSTRRLIRGLYMHWVSIRVWVFGASASNYKPRKKKNLYFDMPPCLHITRFEPAFMKGNKWSSGSVASIVVATHVCKHGMEKVNIDDAHTPTNFHPKVLCPYWRRVSED